MRVAITLLLALPALALAENQVPLFDKLKGYWDKAKDTVSSAVPAAPSPLQAGAAKAAKQLQHDLTLENWKTVVSADSTGNAPTTQEWLVFVTGGNSTCFGLCGNTTKAWNTSLPVLAAQPNPPKFAVVDCDDQPVLCNSWNVGPPSLFHFQIPKPLADQSAPAPTVRYLPLNRTTTTPQTFKSLVLDREYEKTAPYEGPWHPFSGILQQYGVAVPYGYILWGFSKMPSWMPMILISFLSRSFMNRRMRGDPPATSNPPASQ